ncbi:MAG: hypothetical protein QF792_03140, partial [Phycisphaerae bacterium]|nr:hypothetical protein [Phycisphaerae bacterium]
GPSRCRGSGSMKRQSKRSTSTWGLYHTREVVARAAAAAGEGCCGLGRVGRRLLGGSGRTCGAAIRPWRVPNR